MHELSIAMSIIDVAEEEARRRGGAPVLAVHLKLGPLAGVVDEFLRSAWELACERTLLEGSSLVIEQVPLVVRCPACQADRPAVSIQQIRCRECGHEPERILSGRELEVTAMEIQESADQSEVHE